MIGIGQRQLSLPASTESLERFRTFVGDTLREAGAADDLRDRMTRAIHDALTSIVWGAADAIRIRGNGSDYRIDVAFDINSTRVKITVAEGWRDFADDTVVTEDDMLAEARRMQAHEFSMRALCATFDEINYAFKKGFENELTLMKFV